MVNSSNMWLSLDLRLMIFAISDLYPDQVITQEIKDGA